MLVGFFSCPNRLNTTKKKKSTKLAKNNTINSYEKEMKKWTHACYKINEITKKELKKPPHKHDAHKV